MVGGPPNRAPGVIGLAWEVGLRGAEKQGLPGLVGFDPGGQRTKHHG